MSNAGILEWKHSRVPVEPGITHSRFIDVFSGVDKDTNSIGIRMQCRHLPSGQELEIVKLHALKIHGKISTSSTEISPTISSHGIYFSTITGYLDPESILMELGD